MEAGLKLKRVRETLGLRYRQVEQASSVIAARRGSAEYLVGLSRLADIENKGVVPSIHRLYTLCAIYRLDIAEVLEWYGVDISHLLADGTSAHPSKTHTLSPSVLSHGSVALPLKLDPGVDLRKTTYLSRMIQQWGRVPLGLLDSLEIDECRYGIIGTEDYLMYPMLRPGALVQIDENQRQIQNAGWTHEFERPIYFLELRDGYACGWCSLTGQQLIMQPHPGSPCEPQLLSLQDVDIVGRVVGVAMQFAERAIRIRKKTRARSAANPK
jgi:transcriptional regulator with XRE-family HTH domain